MIEGGNAGGSAQLQAAERRAHAERLQAEAARLDIVAGDERATAGRLAALPESYVILHDLTLPDGRGRVDHVVIGPGGAFLVLTRRVAAEVTLVHGQLSSGGTSMKGLVDGARVEAQVLTQALGTPVVPVIGIVGAPVAADLPGAVDGALVCPSDQLATVISRGSHTLLPSTQVHDVADKAVPLLTVAGTRPRAAVATVPPPPAAVPPPPRPAAAAAAAPAAGGAAARTPRSEHARHSRRFVIAAIASACLVAFAAGSLLRVLFHDDPEGASPALTGGSGSEVASTLAGSTTIEVATTAPGAGAASTTVAPPVANVPAPKVSVLPVCQTPGSGWMLVPAWPGPLKGLDKYVVQVLGADGSWTAVTAFRTNDTVKAAIKGQPPNTTLTVRIIAVMKDGSRSPGAPTPILTPATSC